MKNLFLKILLLSACILAVVSFATSQQILVIISAALILIALISMLASEPEKEQPKAEEFRTEMRQPKLESQEPASFKSQSKQDSPLHAYAATKADVETPKSSHSSLSADELNNEKISVLNKFASVASHDLKNPLSSMKNIAYYFTHSVKIDGEVPNKMLKMLGSEVDRMNNMIVELLDVTRVKQLNPSVCELDALINEAAEREKTDSVLFEMRLENMRINVDPERFKQVIKSIIVNAKDAMPDGGKIVISSFKVSRYAIIEISDSGKGMDKTALAKCFDPMFTTKTVRALGMSLTVAKQIVTMSGGNIKAESASGNGAKFIIQLPLA